MRSTPFALAAAAFAFEFEVRDVAIEEAVTADPGDMGVGRRLFLPFPSPFAPGMVSPRLRLRLGLGPNDGNGGMEEGEGREGEELDFREGVETN